MELRHRQFDLAISPQWDVDEASATMLCALTDASRRVGHSAQVTAVKRRINRGFDAVFEMIVPPTPIKHELDNNLAIAEALGANVRSRKLEIRLTHKDRKFAEELLKHHDGRRLLAALGIGRRTTGRKLPLERYADLIAVLNEQRAVQTVIVCSTEEGAEASAFSVKLAVPPYILSGAPLRAVCGVLERCDLFVGNDTGTAHLAAAMDCPTVVVSRHPADGDPGHANSPARFGPRCSYSGTLINLTGVLAGIALRASMPILFVMAVGGTTLCNLAAVTCLLLYQKPWLRPRFSFVRWIAARDLLGSGSGFFLIQIAGAVVFSSDNVVVSHYLGAAQVTPYSVTWRLVGLAAVAQGLMFPALWPAYAEAYAKGDYGWMRRTFRITMCATVAFNAGFALLLVSCGRPLIQWWAGVAAVPSTALLVAMATWAVISGCMTAESCLLAAVDRTHVQGPCPSLRPW